MKRTTILIIVVAAFFSSCAHAPIIHPDPDIDVILPASGGIYNNGDTVHIEMTLSDHDALHEAFILVNSDVDTFFNYEPYVHDLGSFDVDTFWVVTGMSTGVSAFVTAQAHNHHEGITTINIPITLVP